MSLALDKSGEVSAVGPSFQEGSEALFTSIYFHPLAHWQAPASNKTHLRRPAIHFTVQDTPSKKSKNAQPCSPHALLACQGFVCMQGMPIAKHLALGCDSSTCTASPDTQHFRHPRLFPAPFSSWQAVSRLTSVHANALPFSPGTCFRQMLVCMQDRYVSTPIGYADPCTQLIMHRKNISPASHRIYDRSRGNMLAPFNARGHEII